MNRTSKILFALAFALVSSVVFAQAVHRVPTGAVSGVELQIDGRLVAAHGRPLRLSLTAFEVLGLDRLRRARDVTINVYASFRLDRPVATLTTDANGRAFAVVPIPDDTDTGFSVVVEARTPSRVVRRFEFPVSFEVSRELVVSLAPNTVFPGSPLHVGGRLTDRFDGHGLAGAEMVVELSGPRGPIGGQVRLTTDSTGTFRSSTTLASDAPLGTYTATVRVEGDSPIAQSASAQVVARNAPPMLVSVAASTQVASPRATIELDVAVRRPDGRPIEGATVKTVARTDEITEGRTDARGRVHLSYRVGAGASDERVAVTVEKAGVGSGRGGAIVRVSSARYAARVSFEGGRFAAALGGRAYARVVTIDGRPVPAGVVVTFSGPRVRGGSARAVTDATGVATTELAIGPSPSAEEEVSDSCGGSVATEITVQVGEGAGTTTTMRCLLLDPDGVLRVRANVPRVARGAAFAVHVDRVASIARSPVVVELIDLSTNPSAAAHHGSVLAASTIAAGASDASFTMPTDVSGLVGIRARVLGGDGSLELRGASSVILAQTAAPFAIDGRFDRERSTLDVDFTSEPGEPAFVSALAMPYDDAVGIVRGYDAASQITELPSITADEISHGESWLVAQLADLVPTDEVAAHAYVEGRIAPRPASEDPESEGRLRDPYRARARFVEGRLGLLFRALETFVAQSVPGDEDEVMHVANGRFEFNDAVLSAVAAEGNLGAEGATGLGGEPITIAQLRAIDPSFDYDAVARRVSRVRLFQLLLSLRQFVSSHGFDLAWARPGDPRVWVERMVEEGSGQATTDSLVDGWGRPFQLIVTNHARFQLLQPVQGFELVSAGPDGRYGNGDDVFDPTSRVLPAGSVYAQSVLEDALVARLRGVELSRATLSQVTDLFGVYVGSPGEFGTSEQGTAISTPSARFPTILVQDPEPLAVRRISRTIPSALFGPIPRDSGRISIPIELGSEPRSWGIVVYALTPSGEMATTLVRATTGTGILAHGELPARLDARFPTTIDLAITNVSSSGRPLSLRTVACEGMSLTVPSVLELAPEVSASIRATLRSSSVGRCPTRLEVLDGERVVASFERTIDVSSGAHPERRRATALVGTSEISLDVAAPSGATRTQARLTIVDSSAIAELPELAPFVHEHPSLLAWSRVESGRSFDDSLRDRVLATHQDPTRSPSTLDRSLAAIALSSRIDDTQARTLRDRLMGESGSFGTDAIDAADGASGHRRMAAAVVAAFAITGAPDPDDESASEPVARLFARLVPELRAAVRADVASPTELAFPAAALLLIDAHDGHGRALYDRVLAASTKQGAMRSLAPATGHELSEAAIAEVAMAIAAHELGRPAESLEFARHALTLIPSIGRSSEDGPFWLAAMSVYGTFANDVPAEAEVSIGGHTQRVHLEDGRVVLPVPIGAGDRVSIDVRGVSGPWILAESEVAYERVFTAESNGPLTVSIAGDPGRAYGLGALELTVAASEPVFDPVVELELPACVEPDETLLRALRASPAVRSVDVRRAGFLRLVLRPMQTAETTIPLPLSFQAVGTITGLAASAYPASESYRRTVLGPRTMELAE